MKKLKEFNVKLN